MTPFDESYYRLFSLVDSNDLLPTRPKIREDQMGFRVTSGVVSIEKDESNLIGISISGGVPFCPCLYIVQVFDNTPASGSSQLEAGDEITGLNGVNVKGKTKEEVAKIIQESPKQLTITYNKLHIDPDRGKTLDIYLKKIKHKMVENMSSTTADALGLSRAILYNDNMVKKIQELEKNENTYKELAKHCKNLLKDYLKLCKAYRKFADIMSSIGVKEPNTKVSEAFTQCGEAHRMMEKHGIDVVLKLKPILTDLQTYINKAIPDTKLTLNKYADAKFEYLSFCLKIKEMDDEKHAYAALEEPLPRMESGNYEYRAVLRCRQEARAKLARLRQDVLAKMDLLDQRRIQDLGFQMHRMCAALALCYHRTAKVLRRTKVFPVEPNLILENSPSSINAYVFDNDDIYSNDDSDDDLILSRGSFMSQSSISHGKNDDDCPPLDLSLDKIGKEDVTKENLFNVPTEELVSLVK